MSRRAREVKRTRDYVAAPKDAGRRAVHLVVEKKGVLVEIQLRTVYQRRWAMEVERLEFKTNRSSKDGRGDPKLPQLFRALGEALGLLDAGQAVDPDSRAELERPQNELEEILS